MFTPTPKYQFMTFIIKFYIYIQYFYNLCNYNVRNVYAYFLSPSKQNKYTRYLVKKAE